MAENENYNNMEEENFYMTVEELYNKLGEFVKQGLGKKFVRLDIENFEYTIEKDRLDGIKMKDDQLVLYSDYN